MGREEILPELGGNFRLRAVDQKRPFFPRAGPFLAFLPFKEAYGKAGPLREAPYKKGRLMGSYWERFYQNWAGISACAP